MILIKTCRKCGAVLVTPSTCVGSSVPMAGQFCSCLSPKKEMRIGRKLFSDEMRCEECGRLAYGSNHANPCRCERSTSKKPSGRAVSRCPNGIMMIASERPCREPRPKRSL